MVGHLAQNAKDAGSSPAQCYTFHLREKFTLRENLFIIKKKYFLFGLKGGWPYNF